MAPAPKRLMRDRRFVPFVIQEHLELAYPFVGQMTAAAFWDLFPPIDGYKPYRRKARTPYVNVAAQHRSWSRVVIERDGRQCLE